MPLWPEALKDVPKEKRCIIKQADVVMLMYLMEHEFAPEIQRINFDYYENERCIGPLSAPASIV